MKRFYKDQNGAAIAVLFTILVPLLFLSLVGIVTFTNAITNSDITVQESVAISSKAAALAIDAVAQADGVIRIDTIKAHENFRKSLRETLGLEHDLTPSKTFVDKPKYWLLVYNGFDDYVDCECATLYHYDGIDVVKDSLLANEFPVTFSISESGITVGSSDRQVELKTPGVVSVIAIDASNVADKSTSTIVRWSAARIEPGKNSNFVIKTGN